MTFSPLAEEADKGADEGADDGEEEEELVEGDDDEAGAEDPEVQEALQALNEEVKKGPKNKKDKKKRDKKQSAKTASKANMKNARKHLRLSEVAYKPHDEEYRLFEGLDKEQIEFEPFHDSVAKMADKDNKLVPAAEIETKYPGVKIVDGSENGIVDQLSFNAFLKRENQEDHLPFTIIDEPLKCINRH
jgi:hypothetical protein